MSLTSKDLQAIRSLMVSVAEKEFRMVVREVLGERTALLVTKDEFYRENDKVMTELKTIRQEMRMQGVRISRLEKRPRAGL